MRENKEMKRTRRKRRNGSEREEEKIWRAKGQTCRRRRIKVEKIMKRWRRWKRHPWSSEKWRK